ncbi:hypothetical protein GBA52_027416 [Prunus armeniaca]|nr:hypothetical protein GBA52_027416 [Prunus armeniaca]
MAFQILKRNLFPATKPRPLSVSHFSSSSPSDQTPSQTNPLISDVVSILTNLRSKTRWSYLRSLYPNGFDSNDFSQIALTLKTIPVLPSASSSGPSTSPSATTTSNHTPPSSTSSLGPPEVPSL